MPEPEEPNLPPEQDLREPVDPFAEPVDSTENSKQMDDVLDRLLGNDDSEPAREPPTPEPSAPDADFDRALKALQRDGVPTDVIDGMKSNPSKLKEWGLKAAKRQADVDAFGSKMAQSKKNDAEAPKKEAESSSQTQDGEADADPLSEFGTIFGDEAVKPIRSTLDRMREEFDSRARAIEVKYETKTAYDAIAREYGAKAPDFDEIVEEAARLGRERPNGFESVKEIVREAFRAKAGDPKKTDLRDVARPTAGKPPARPVHKVDVEDAVLDVLLSGGTRQDALRAASR